MSKPIVYVRAVGESLYGQLWQSELARGLGVSDRSVRRWVAGDADPPEDIVPRLRTLIDKRMAMLRKVRHSLPT
jgi:DNA-binding transcriptional regulator YiaG